MSFQQQPNRSRGFTLVELIVSMAILSIMLLAMASVMGYVTKLWLNGIGAVDNFTKARVVLNLLDRDIQMMVLRRDVAAFVDSSGGSTFDAQNNPQFCAFYTNVQGGSSATGYTPDSRTVSLVQYLLNTSTTTPTLMRKNYGMNYLTSSGTTPSIASTQLSQLANSNMQSETVFTGIIRFQIQFLDGTGAINSTYNFPPTSFVSPLPASNTRSVVVSMLVLSNSAYNLATQSGSTTMSTLLTDFPNTLGAGCVTYSQYWNSILNPTTGPDVLPNLPPQVRGGIQVFERHIPLPITTPTS